MSTELLLTSSYLLLGVQTPGVAGQAGLFDLIQNTGHRLGQRHHLYRLSAFAEGAFASSQLAHLLVDAFLGCAVAEVTQTK